MSKDKTNSTILPVPPITDSVPLPVNYPGLEYITWFIADSQNAQNLAGIIFRGGINTNDPNLVQLLAATNKAITETLSDITNIQTLLNQITPVTK